MNYLVPIDFSDNSKTAAEYAGGLTKIWNGNLHLAHVIVPIEDEPSYLPVKTLNVKKNTIFEIIRYQEELRRKYGVRTSCDMLKGGFLQQIHKTTRKEKSDIIVTGRQGLTGLRKHLYGSNTMTLIQESGIPVLVVPQSILFKPFKHIVYHTDFQPEETDHVTSLLKISRKFNARFSVVAVNPNVRVGFQNKFIDDLNAKSICAFSFEVLSGTEGTAERLLHYVQETDADLLSLTTLDQQLILKLAGRSLTSEFVFKADIPVLYFPH